MSSAPIRWALERASPQAAPCALCLRLLGFVFPIGESGAIAYELGVDVAAIDGACSEVAAITVEAGHPTGQSALPQFTGQRCASLAAAGVGLTVSLTGLVQLGRVDAGEPQLPVVEPQRVAVDRDGLAGQRRRRPARHKNGQKSQAPQGPARRGQGRARRRAARGPRLIVGKEPGPVSPRRVSGRLTVFRKDAVAASAAAYRFAYSFHE